MVSVTSARARRAVSVTNVRAWRAVSGTSVDDIDVAVVVVAVVVAVACTAVIHGMAATTEQVLITIIGIRLIQKPMTRAMELLSLSYHLFNKLVIGKGCFTIMMLSQSLE